MINRLKKLSISLLSLVIACVLIGFATGCSKSSNPNFTGTYIGKASLGSYTEADTIIVTVGSNSSAIIMESKTGAGSTYVIDATTSGSSINIPSQSVYVNTLSTTYTTTGSGNLSGSTLNLNYLFVSPTNTSYNWSFSGTKQ